MGKMKEVNRLAVMDWSTNTIHVYQTAPDLEVTDEYVENLGFKMTQCHYMTGKVSIIEHQGILL